MERPRSLSHASLSALLLLGATACAGPEEAAPVAGNRAAAATVISVTDLGTLPGGTRSRAQAINNLSEIVGSSNDAALTTDQPVIWVGGAVSALASSPSGFTPRAINRSREAVGGNTFWGASGIPVLLPSATGTGSARGNDINKSGLVVGSSQDGTAFDTRAVAWNRAELATDLGFLGAGPVGLPNYTEAFGVNDRGDIVGEGLVALAPFGFEHHAFLWSSGTFTDLGRGGAVDVNNCGLVAGNEGGDFGLGFPWVWQSGVRTNLPGLAGEPTALGARVLGLNNAGDLVGYAPISAPGTFSASTAVLWRGGVAINLGPLPGGVTSLAQGINDRGEVVGVGGTGTASHAALWNVGIAGGLTAPAVTLAATSSTSTRTNRSLSFRGAFADPDCGPWTYTFDWGNGSTSGTAATPGAITASRSYARKGTYRVSLTVTDANGASGRSAAVTVTVR